MDLLHRIKHVFDARFRERVTVAALSRLDDRRLADLGLNREDIPLAARLVVRRGAGEITLGDLVRQLREDEAARLAAGAAERPISRQDLDHYIRQARTMRAQAQADLIRSAGRGVVRLGQGLAGSVTAAVDGLGLLKPFVLARMWRREYAKARAELETYSDRELTIDMRLNRSDIPGIAAEAADERVAAFVRRNPRYRSAWAGGGRREARARHA